MVKTGAKKRELRRNRVPPGDVRRGAGGETEMIEFNEYRPNPFAPSILVNRPGGIYRIGNLIKVTFALATFGSGGIPDCIERVSLLWEQHDVHEANEALAWAFKEIRSGAFIAPGDGGRRLRTQ